ncbi:uncharacterized protein LOC114186044 [Vigna unguiculata]|uniref:Uncharacterized protein n=1 Tax=Vigna unguiculata TaxID=3917 RepID=A0A4D6NDM1_VIGUN|nr:uncharacterized protein LOC114186044 [Vigna unguiculata]QCE09977.1 hypothetical protein DEO72_LG10g1200 [Vigna unguiculata]
MAKRFPSVLSNQNLFKHLQSTTSIAARVSSSGFCIPNADVFHHLHTQGGESVVGAAAAEGAVNATEAVESVGEKAKETVNNALNAELVAGSTMAEADTNVVDTAEYRSSEDLGGHLGDGHDTYT